MSEDLLDMGGYPEFFAHDIASMDIVGPNAELVLFRWRKIDGVWRRCTAGIVTRPIDSLIRAAEMVKLAAVAATEMVDPAVQMLQ